MRWSNKPWAAWRRRAGLTLVEVLIATAIGAGVSVGLASLLVMSSRMQKSILTQQVCLSQEIKSLEALNREIRMAAAPLMVTDGGGGAAIQGNRVVFARMGEAAGRRAIALVSDDDDLMTPGDNRLLFDPDTGKSGDEVLLARNVTPLEAGGAFRYEGATRPLQVDVRLGDPASGATAQSDAATGAGTQGVEISISIAPRNDSTQ